MPRILFMRRFRPVSAGRIRITGGHIKLRDYFRHCLDHPGMEPYIYFTPDSVYQDNELWVDVPRNRIVSEIAVEAYDVFFVLGKDWKFLPKDLNGHKVINRLVSLEHADKDNRVFRYLKRPAYRFCSSQQIMSAILPHVSGDVSVINNGIPLDLFKPAEDKQANTVLIWARKHPEFGTKLHQRLTKLGIEARLIVDNLPRAAFAGQLGEADILVSLPQVKEGFYLPALEGMASGCAVVCPDAIGNRDFCVHERNCLMPRFEDLDDHVGMIERLWNDREFKMEIQQSGMETARSFSLEAEREQFYRFLETYIL